MSSIFSEMSVMFDDPRKIRGINVTRWKRATESVSDDGRCILCGRMLDDLNRASELDNVCRTCEVRRIS
jgi:hypothetical protein